MNKSWGSRKHQRKRKKMEKRTKITRAKSMRKMKMKKTRTKSLTLRQTSPSERNKTSLKSKNDYIIKYLVLTYLEMWSILLMVMT
jgi:hypothetical protein